MTARVLIVEDNAANLQLMSYLLRAHGHAVIETVDGEAGVDAARREVPDLVLLDLQLPRLDGFGVLSVLRLEESLTGVPVVAVTAFAMVGDRDKVLAAGFDGYLAKPIVPETFVDQIEAYLPRAKAGSRPVAAHARPTVSEAQTPDSLGIVVLVVDDTPANQQLMRSVLEPSGYAVLCADSVEAGLAVARARRPDVVVCDAHLPDGNGFQLIEALRADPALSGVPCGVVSSTYRLHDMERRAHESGAFFLSRPAEPQELLDAIERALQGSRQ